MFYKYVWKKFTISADMLDKDKYIKKLKALTKTEEITAAVGQAFIESLHEDLSADPNTVWKTLSNCYIHSKFGKDVDFEFIQRVDKAVQGWKRSSGVAMENALLFALNPELGKLKISIGTSKRLLYLLEKRNDDGYELVNDKPDKEALLSALKSRDFDMFVFSEQGPKKLACFGTIQVKTSIRDRLNMNTRPSLDFMKKCFWSTVICLDVDNYLQLPKFNSMASTYWHGFYVLSNRPRTDKSIYYFQLAPKGNLFVEHASKAAAIWAGSGRLRMNETWRV